MPVARTLRGAIRSRGMNTKPSTSSPANAPGKPEIIESKLIVGDNPEVLKSAEKWLNEQGYRLEYQASRAMEEAGFEASLGSMLAGSDGVQREVDVLARSRKCELVREQPYECAWVEFAALIECKFAKRPWIMLGDVRHPKAEGLLAALPHSRSMRLGRKAASRSLLQSDLSSFSSMRDSLARSVVVSHSPRGDEDAYRTLQKVADLAWAASQSEPAAKLGRGAIFILPVVIIDGPLFAATYAAEEGRFRIARRRIGHLLWSAPKLPLTLIDLVEASCLPAYLKLLQPSRDQLTALAIHRLKTMPAAMVVAPSNS